MEKKMYFDVPTRVIWIDEDGYANAGIAYRDEVICACCGGVSNIWEIYEFAPEGVEYPITELKWVNVRKEFGSDYLCQEVENEI